MYQKETLHSGPFKSVLNVIINLHTARYSSSLFKIKHQNIVLYKKSIFIIFYLIIISCNYTSVHFKRAKYYQKEQKNLIKA